MDATVFSQPFIYNLYLDSFSVYVLYAHFDLCEPRGRP